jgi:hypothetical protein
MTCDDAMHCVIKKSQETFLGEKGKQKPGFDFLLKSISSAADAKQPYLILFATGLLCGTQKILG